MAVFNIHASLTSEICRKETGMLVEKLETIVAPNREGFAFAAGVCTGLIILIILF
jgi:hypothetical protein